MRFFRKHNVSIETQIQVMYSLFETRAAQVMQRHFQQLMDENLPDELRRTVSEELWVPHLMSLGLIVHVKDWHSAFLGELSLRVREEVIASKTILCKEDTPSVAAYYIIEGRLAVVSSSSMRGPVPDFAPGMWVGEQSFVNPARRRNHTIIARTLTRLMMLPSNSFHELISQLGLQARFNAFRETQLEKGLCGRCGDVGDHFTHVCPQFTPGSTPWRFSKKGRCGTGTAIFEEETPRAKGDHLQAYLHGHRLMSLMPLLESQGVQTVEDLEHVNLQELKLLVGHDEHRLVQVELLQALQEDKKKHDFILMNDGEMKSEHLIFLSHFKLEAGTEAALMRGEIESLLRQNGDEAVFEWFNSPIFLDSEDLYNLEDLTRRVRKTHNLVLLLTKDVLTRPWCLVELVCAVNYGVRILPVQVMKRGDSFSFPDEDFYTKLLGGQLLDHSCMALLTEHGIELGDVEKAIKSVFKKIALPYSPHRSETIRRAEVQALLKQVRPRNPHSDNNVGARRSRRPLVAASACSPHGGGSGSGLGFGLGLVGCGGGGRVDACRTSPEHNVVVGMEDSSSW